MAKRSVGMVTTIPARDRRKQGIHPRLRTPIVSSCTSLILSSSGEIAMQFWWKYLYTGDRAFLKEKAYPLMKAVG